jgi:hypothetical protein
MFANSLNKRIIPILYRDVSQKNFPEPLAKVQWINFKTTDTEFDVAFRQLLLTLETDREHVEAHTYWLQKALIWEEHQYHDDLLLSSSENTKARQWLENAVDKDPHPTVKQRNLIECSTEEILFKTRLTTSYFRLLLANLLISMFFVILWIGLDIYNTRQNLVEHLSVSAKVIEENVIVFLTFFDSENAGKMLSGLSVNTHIKRAAIYNKQ